MDQGQRSRGPRSIKGSKQRQMASQQCQVASLITLEVFSFFPCTFLIGLEIDLFLGSACI